MTKKKTPALGDQILDPPNTPVVTDPQEIEDALRDTVPATDLVERLAAKLSGPTILLEGGARINVLPDQKNNYRVYGLDHTAYDHCHDAEDGEWIYRKA